MWVLHFLSVSGLKMLVSMLSMSKSFFSVKSLLFCHNTKGHKLWYENVFFVSFFCCRRFPLGFFSFWVWSVVPFLCRFNSFPYLSLVSHKSSRKINPTCMTLAQHFSWFVSISISLSVLLFHFVAKMALYLVSTHKMCSNCLHIQTKSIFIIELIQCLVVLPLFTLFATI